MREPDYEGPEVEARWCDEQRRAVETYLRAEGVVYREVGDWPAWHLAPLVAIWAVESMKRPGWIGWWVISGDLPTDYISADEIDPPQHPRKAVCVFADRWRNYAKAWSDGNDYVGTHFDPHMRAECAPLLAQRSESLAALVENDAAWEE